MKVVTKLMTKMEISSKIRYIGADDLDIDLFESQYVVPEGMSYNSYVILDDKIAVMDTADARVAAQWKRQLSETLAGRTPDYLVCHHMEPDHAGLIGEVMGLYPGMKLVCSAAAAKMLPNFFDGVSFGERLLLVKEGDTLELGHHTLHFVAAPMVHWPEVMMSYESEERVLFAADGFGKFGAICKEEYNADGTLADWACEARRYYFNICGKYGVQVQNVLKKAAPLQIDTICPLHGPVLRGKDLAEALRLYDIWSRYEAENEGVLVAYASITRCAQGGCQRPLSRRFGRSHRGCVPLSAPRVLRRQLRRQCLPAHVRLSPPSAHQGLPEASCGALGERLLGAFRRQDDARPAGADEGHHDCGSDGDDPFPHEGERSPRH